MSRLFITAAVPLLRAQSGAALGDYSWRLFWQKEFTGGFTTRASTVSHGGYGLPFQRPWALGRLIMLRHNVPVRRDLDQIAALSVSTFILSTTKSIGI